MGEMKICECSTHCVCVRKHVHEKLLQVGIWKNYDYCNAEDLHVNSKIKSLRCLVANKV